MVAPVLGNAPGVDAHGITDCLSDAVHDAQVTAAAAAWWDLWNDAFQSESPYNLIVYAHDVPHFPIVYLRYGLNNYVWRIWPHISCT
jgi:hypothetical protein